MTPTWILGCVGVGWTAFCLLIADWAYSADRRVARRMRDASRGQGPGSSQPSTLFRDWRPAVDGRASVVGKLRLILEQSGLRIPLRHVLLASGWCALIAAAVGLSWNSWGWGCGLAGVVLPFLIVAAVRRRRIARMRNQLPEVFDIMRRAVEAGQSVPSAFQQVATQGPVPLASEFASCAEQQNLGMSHEAALRNLVQRVPIIELNMLVVALILQRQCGGSPIDVLDNMADLIRKRQRLARRIQALTAEGRMQALVLTVLPILTFAGLAAMRPEYIAPVLQRPGLLLLMAALQVTGTIWVRQTVRLEY